MGGSSSGDPLSLYQLHGYGASTAPQNAQENYTGQIPLCSRVVSSQRRGEYRITLQCLSAPLNKYLFCNINS